MQLNKTITDIGTGKIQNKTEFSDDMNPREG
jgi:hypothetical protein